MYFGYPLNDSFLLLVQEMAKVLAEHLTEDTQVKLFRGTVLTILKKCGEELHLEVGDEVMCAWHNACRCSVATPTTTPPARV